MNRFFLWQLLQICCKLNHTLPLSCRPSSFYNQFIIFYLIHILLIQFYIFDCSLLIFFYVVHPFWLQTFYLTIVKTVSIHCVFSLIKNLPFFAINHLPSLIVSLQDGQVLLCLLQAFQLNEIFKCLWLVYLMSVSKFHLAFFFHWS